MQFKWQDFKEGEHAGKSLWTMKTFDSPKYPPRDKCIRMYMQKYFLFWNEGNDIVGYEVSTFDMGGYVPKRLINMSIGAQIKKGVEMQYKQLIELQKESDSTGTNTD